MPRPDCPYVGGSIGQVGQTTQVCYSLTWAVGSDLEWRSTNMDFCVSNAKNIKCQTSSSMSRSFVSLTLLNCFRTVVLKQFQTQCIRKPGNFSQPYRKSEWMPANRAELCLTWSREVLKVKSTCLFLEIIIFSLN